MEIELKYNIDNSEKVELILADPWIIDRAEEKPPETIRMKAAYFDTEDLILTRSNIAFRIRSEGKKTVATLKWKDDDEGIRGLYVRSEINIPVSDQTSFFHPDPSIFSESREGADLLDVVEGRKLVNIFDMIFTRKRLRIDYGHSILEISLDEGTIVASTKSLGMCELEIELFSGEKADLLAVGKKISEKYSLNPEIRTKFARGVALLAEESGAGLL